ncbi:hypothetical protein TNCV_1340411 [Trichonephila clavipes]|nr:hypothetical protein TNCV_1340411 [Trichonephila clavipes]
MQVCVIIPLIEIRSVCHRICRRQLIWREWYCLSSRKYPGKGPISGMQYYVWAGIMINGRKKPTCGCEWDYDDGQRYIDTTSSCSSFSCGAVGDKFVFLDDNATCHRTLAVQDCLDSEGIQRANGQRVLQI